MGETKEARRVLGSQVPGKPTVLVVEDDPGIAEAVVYALERDGMAVRRAGTLAAARTAVAGVDLAVLDLGLPDGSGYTLLSEWRAGGEPAVIVLTSRDGEVDCVAALEAGADDFVTKPFSPRALVARVRAVLRRRDGAAPAVAPLGSFVKSASLVIDLERRTVKYDGRVVELTKLELDLLAVLAASPGRVHTRDQLVRRVWGDAYALTERTVDSHVKALRRKLSDARAGPSCITAVRGVGFKWDERGGAS